MDFRSSVKKLPAVILAGGKGTRLRDVVPDLPKPMIPILGRPFLDYIIAYLRHQGVDEIILSVGHKAHRIKSYVDRLPCSSDRISLVYEDNPLGTGGAVRRVVSQAALRGWFLVLNGDSLVRFDLARLVETVANADAAMICVRAPDTTRFGRVSFNEERMLIGFEEKAADGPALSFVNAGIYLLHRAMIELTPECTEGKAVSLEEDCFPLWLSTNKRIKVVLSDGPFIDIGTPESLALAPEFIRASWSDFIP